MGVGGMSQTRLLSGGAGGDPARLRAAPVGGACCSLGGGSQEEGSQDQAWDIVGGVGMVRRSETAFGKGNSSPLQYPCLENPMNRGAWWATVRGVTRSLDMTG